ncbi:MAG: YdeI/OmpD-associated family protein [Erythrobacter sp.]|nr:YdeI/OmpD-associated family protein [Erythrobacter sp.]
MSFAHGTVHQAGADIQAALTADAGVLALWESLTPLARNEFICWIDDAKREPTRKKRVAWMVDSLREGKRRPCCWAGCVHRDDKAPSKSQQWVISRKGN